ncbi:MAG: alpha/beta fold hydrolase [Gammaproteobacteria bacterium]|nr:alpha/beta fold hydrolase [Gammaproteobacteria bacterium]
MSQILMLHGWGFPGAVYTSLIDKLATDFEVRAPDRRGYGGNVDNGDSCEITRLDSPTLLVGWSLGGLAALQLALRQPDMVTGLVLLATTPCFVNHPDWTFGMDNEVFDAFHKLVLDDPVTAMQQFVRLNAGRRPDGQSTVVLSNLSSKVTPYALQHGMSELAETDLRDAVTEVDQPVLLLHAADDRVVPAKASTWLQENLPLAKRFEFQTGGHAFFLQQSDEVAEHIRTMA